MSQLTCFSGGAIGADTVWGRCTQQRGGDAVHYSFPGHRTSWPEETLVLLSDEQLARGLDDVRRAAAALGRPWPLRRPHDCKLIQRNWWQVHRSYPVYAVSTIRDDGHVNGGTAWALQMYEQRQPPHLEELRCYLFDQVRETWLQRVRHPTERWRVLPNGPPPPEDEFTGIGSRDLLHAGRVAIHDVFKEST